ncbi:MAG: polysaccharide deacetylase family protein [Lachnospiraceae bacterium]|nr:polysaccharide deacetylase family protein [Lachnospiraceae bacterium]
MSDKKIISLTFDDGPTIGITDQVLDVLEKYNARASFFLIGQQIKPETEYLIKRALSLGCTIENHTKTHPSMPKLSDEEILMEVKYTTDKIEEVTGEKPKFFRPPYIDVDDRMFDLIDLTFICGRGCDDWVMEVSAEERTRKILDAAEDGAIILVHDMEGNVNTIEAIKTVIPTLMAEGYEFVNVREIFEARDKAIDHKVMYSEF